MHFWIHIKLCEENMPWYFKKKFLKYNVNIHKHVFPNPFLISRLSIFIEFISKYPKKF